MKTPKENSYKRTTKPQNISSILDRAFYNPEIKKKVRQYSAFPFWPEIVGEKVAEVAKPEKIIKGKILQIRVLDAVWAQELSLMKGKIIDDFYRFGEGAIIEDIKFIIGNPKNFKK